jgi:hypothetical protein
MLYVNQTKWIEDVGVQDVDVGPSHIVVVVVNFLHTADFASLFQYRRNDRSRSTVEQAPIHANPLCGPRIHIHRCFESTTQSHMDKAHQPTALACQCIPWIERFTCVCTTIFNRIHYFIFELRVQHPKRFVRHSVRSAKKPTTYRLINFLYRASMSNYGWWTTANSALFLLQEGAISSCTSQHYELCNTTTTPVHCSSKCVC